MDSRKLAVQLNNVTREINKHVILNNMSLEIEHGQICGLMGSNGSGKSMLLKVISGLIGIDSGSVFVFGKQVDQESLATDIGILIEMPGLLLHKSAYQNLKMLCMNDNKENQIDCSLSNLGLNPSDKRPVKKYSLGMKQKVGIAQATFDIPKLILLDEPTSNLDEKSAEKVFQLIDFLNKKHGATIIITSHQKETINNICNSIFNISHGNIDKVL